VLAFLGYALNDSGIAIPALMCETVVAALAFLTPLAESIDPDAVPPDEWTRNAPVAPRHSG